jgi:NAD(P)-dependent dehydrogenase (short-subunit alcohol dehydrogenase family)
VITGGASGIGRATAVAPSACIRPGIFWLTPPFAEQGANVVISGRRETEGAMPVDGGASA